ncbi:hypothetical protein TWF694_001780 [Orbilia ellipsospora]|uniref:UmuC domain-containing protein n=1 Tax=Orbilia ellipsospora TaxID=2528407 RepID=A0AAV9X4R5_9PEZI
MDVTDQIDYNLAMAEKEGFATGFYQLKPDQPNFGFKFEWDVIPGHLYPPLTKPNSRPPSEVLKKIPKRLLLATHLAQYLRLLLLDQQGFTCSAGVCVSKLTAKLAGTINKPCAQTLLLPDHIQDFLDGLAVLKIPGIGSKTGGIIRDLVVEQKRILEAKSQPETGDVAQESTTQIFDLEEAEDPRQEEIDLEQTGKDDFLMAYYPEAEVKTKVLDARTLISRQRLDVSIGNIPPGAGRVWELLHGIDHTEVAKASLVPTQVSIEDTFRPGTVSQDTTIEQLESILIRLSITLIRRLKTDLLTTAPLPSQDDEAIDITQLDQPSKKWQAFPKTLRISTRDRNTMKYGARNSKSGPMPNFIFALNVRIEETARRLAKEALVPLFRRLHGPDVPGGGKYDLALINIAATNMGNGETGTEGGNVAAMFKRYNEVFPEGDWERKRPLSDTQFEEPLLQQEELYEESSEDVVEKDEDEDEEDEVEDGFLSEDDSFSDGALSEEGSQEVVCKNCHIRLPIFAIGAHERFHKNMDDGESC